MIINLKVTSWNINGVKSLKPSMKTILDDLDSDLICMQEIKSSKETIDLKNAVVDGYNGYFSFCKTKPGYSGVSIFCRNPVVPTTVLEGLTDIIKRFDSLLIEDNAISEHLNIPYEDLISLESEGRALCCEFLIKNCQCGDTNVDHSLWVINVYCPMAELDNKERQHYKKMFNNLISLAVNSIINNKSHVMLVGDLNIVHNNIDIAETVPKEIFLTNRNRHWFDDLLILSQRNPELTEYKSPNRHHAIIDELFVDTFRYLHPSQTGAYSCWNTKIGGRQTNYGTRIDYILADKHLVTSTDKLVECRLLTDIYGSDHCPVTATFRRLELVPSLRIPLLCSTNLPRFRNQSQITSFIVRTQNPLKRNSVAMDSNRKVVANKQAKLVALKDSSTESKSGISDQWKAIFKAQPKAPLCSGHQVASVLRTVMKDSINKGKTFWVCSKPNGLPNHPESRCNFFQWAS